MNKNSSTPSLASDTSLNHDMDTMSVNSDVVSISSTSKMYVQKKYNIELNIKLLYVSDFKYLGQQFKIYWTRGKRKIDTHVATVQKDTQIAKFNDKFQMRTVL